MRNVKPVFEDQCLDILLADLGERMRGRYRGQRQRFLANQLVRYRPNLLLIIFAPDHDISGLEIAADLEERLLDVCHVPTAAPRPVKSLGAKLRSNSPNATIAACCRSSSGSATPTKTLTNLISFPPTIPSQ